RPRGLFVHPRNGSSHPACRPGQAASATLIRDPDARQRHLHDRASPGEPVGMRAVLRYCRRHITDPDATPMLRIRKIADAITPSNRAAIEEAQAIMRAQFPGIDPAEFAKLPDQMENPFKYGFVCLLFVAEAAQDRIQAVALMFYDPELRFSFLDVI